MTETENEVNEKTRIEALISEWKFQNAEGIYTFDRDTMFTKCYQDAYKKGLETNREIDWLTRMNKGYKQQIEHLKGIIRENLGCEFCINYDECEKRSKHSDNVMSANNCNFWEM